MAIKKTEYTKEFLEQFVPGRHYLLKECYGFDIEVELIELLKKTPDFNVRAKVKYVKFLNEDERKGFKEIEKQFSNVVRFTKEGFIQTAHLYDIELL